MQYDVGPIVHEDRDPVKIRRAFALGAAGVIVESDLPHEVTEELILRANNNDDVLQRVEKTGLILTFDPDNEKRCRWGRDEPALMHTCSWFSSQFDWAVSHDLCRKPDITRKDRSLMTLWLNGNGVLPWHIDRQNPLAKPDIHIHAHGRGLVLASPPRPLSLHFTENRASPNLYIPGTGWKDLPISEVTQYLRDRDFQFTTLQPGQMVFFREQCLHKSASGDQLRMRGGIF